ncbi:MAG: hypothetical protein NZM15_05000 [Flavobacteriales bacterium]|nr:hypothetical protein [Flavobacteriales bacterium]MDW8432043.1 hypothetical protein [Flavobacteriales bacterium]
MVRWMNFFLPLRKIFIWLAFAGTLCGCKKRCWQCVRPESGEPIFSELCNDAPDYNRQTLDNYKYACGTVGGVVKESD